MKKRIRNRQAKKLELHRETLRMLDTDTLENVAGGGETDSCEPCFGPYAGPTFGTCYC